MYLSTAPGPALYAASACHSRHRIDSADRADSARRRRRSVRDRAHRPQVLRRRGHQLHKSDGALGGDRVRLKSRLGGHHAAYQEPRRPYLSAAASASSLGVWQGPAWASATAGEGGGAGAGSGGAGPRLRIRSHYSPAFRCNPCCYVAYMSAVDFVAIHVHPRPAGQQGISPAAAAPVRSRSPRNRIEPTIVTHFGGKRGNLHAVSGPEFHPQAHDATGIPG